MIARVEPSLLSRLNERQVLRVLQARGPSSRAEVARQTGLTAPTVSKAVASLLQAGLLEEIDAPEPTRGRPARQLRLASQNVQVLGVVIDAGACQVVAADLDGQLLPEQRCEIPTPDDYEQLLDVLAEQARPLMERRTTLGVGVSLPGLIDYRRQCGVLSPNVPITNNRTPALDLGRRLGVECLLVQESHALCLAERHVGLAQGLDDFAMLDTSFGVGLGVVSGGRLLTGHSGMAGEVGHITVVEGGLPCGCGNVGCLETVASDTSFLRRVGKRLGRKVTIERVLEMVRRGKMSFTAELEDTCRYLAVGVAAVVNLFNPSALFVHGRLFEVEDGLFERLEGLVRRRALPPSVAQCRLVRARGSKPQGAVSAIIQHLTSAIGPSLEGKSLFHRGEVDHVSA